MAPFYYHNLLRGLEQSLVDPFVAPEFTHELLRRISDFFYHFHRRIFEACEGRIDVAEVTDDLGSQTGPLISMDTYKEFYAPHHQRLINLCHEFGIKVSSTMTTAVAACSCRCSWKWALTSSTPYSGRAQAWTWRN